MRRRWGLIVVSLAGIFALSAASLVLAKGGEGYGGYGGATAAATAAAPARSTSRSRARRSSAPTDSVKVKATCGTRGCFLDLRGRLASSEGNGKLKPKRDVTIPPSEQRKLVLKLSNKAKRAASDAEKSKVVVKGKAIGSGGGGTDKARKRIKLKS